MAGIESRRRKISGSEVSGSKSIETLARCSM